jgi:hypothetical protein
MFAKFLYCLIYNNKNHIDLSMIFLSLYGKGQALQVTGGTVYIPVFHYGIAVLVHAGWR